MKGNTGVVSGVRISHDRASVEELEAARAANEQDLLDELLSQPNVEEAFILQTCHRIEAYVVTSDPTDGRNALIATGYSGTEAVFMAHEESLRHLMRVAAGLESVVLGEDQILGQVKDALEAATQVDALDSTLRDAVTKAIHVGERARTETAINEGVVSLGSAAVKLAEREIDLDAASALVVGAGEMGRLAAKAFAATGVDHVVVANRTPENAAGLASALTVDATATDLANLPGLVDDADVVVVATGSDDPVIVRETVDGAGETFVVDLGQPRDVDPAVGDVADVSVRDLGDLESVTDSTWDRREEAAQEVEDLVDDELDHLLTQYKRKRADEVIAAMYESAEHMKAREVSTALDKLEARGDVTDEQREVVESLADTLVSQLLAAPTRSLRDAAAEDDWSTIATALQLFNPEFEGESPLSAMAPSEPSDASAAADAEDD